MNGSNFDREISFDIVEHIGVITTYSTGWNKEINLVSWNGAGPKYDIREWSPDHAHMSRGVTLHEKEMRTILDLIRNRNRRNRYDGTGGGNGNADRSGRVEPDRSGQGRSGQGRSEMDRLEQDRTEDEAQCSASAVNAYDDRGSISCADETEHAEPAGNGCGTGETGEAEKGYDDEVSDVF